MGEVGNAIMAVNMGSMFGLPQLIEWFRQISIQMALSNPTKKTGPIHGQTTFIGSKHNRLVSYRIQ